MVSWSDAISLGNLALSGWGAVESNNQAEKTRQAFTQIAGQQTALAQQALSRDWALQDRVLTQTGDMTAAIRNAMASMGGASYITQDMIEAEANNRLGLYMDNADKAITYTTSTSEADRIRTGMDMSTYDIMKDRENAVFATDTLRSAYNQAYSDSISYLTGRNDAVMRSRGLALEELSKPFDSALKYETAMFGKGISAGSDMTSGAAKNYGALLTNDYTAAAASAKNLGIELQKAADKDKAGETLFSRVFSMGWGKTVER